MAPMINGGATIPTTSDCLSAALYSSRRQVFSMVIGATDLHQLAIFQKLAFCILFTQQ